jgi:hypothetical protein
LRARLALVNAIGHTIGPSARTNGKETGLRITNLREGERIGLKLDQSEFWFTQDGSFPFSQIAKSRMYQFFKHVREGAEPSPTIVEVLLDG